MTKLLVGMIALFALLARRDSLPTARTYVILALGVVILVAATALSMFVLKPIVQPAYP